MFNFSTYICVKLADKAGEVVMFEVFREQITGEFSGAPNDER